MTGLSNHSFKEGLHLLKSCNVFRNSQADTSKYNRHEKRGVCCPRGVVIVLCAEVTRDNDVCARGEADENMWKFDINRDGVVDMLDIVKIVNLTLEN